MNENTLGVIFLILMGGACVLLTVTCIAMEVLNNYRDKRDRRNHPKFFEMTAELNEMVSNHYHYHNDNVAPLIRLVDQILNEWHYYPEEMQIRKGEELELYRRRIQEHKAVLAEMDSKADILREEIRAYNRIHHVSKYWED